MDSLEMQTPIRFFMGANTPGGFVGYLDDLYDPAQGWRAYLIKSGPGTGKSSLMRRVLNEMTAQGLEAEAILCSSDPNSLDGVRFPEIRACIIDATAPHVIEPKYWGAVEQIVNLSACMDAGRLHEQAPKIMEATEACSALHARCRKFLGAAASLLGDSCRIAAEYTDKEKILRSAARIAGREFGGRAEQSGREIRRFLSAVTPQGLVTFHETLQALCPRIYSLEDEYGASSRLLLEELRRRALEAGLDVISCACPLFPKEKLEHLLIPSIGVGFTTSNPWHKADFPVFRRIHAARFTDTEGLRSRRQLLSFNRRAARELLSEAVSIAAEAKAVHDAMERYNIEAMDWEGAAILTGWVVSEFAALAGELPPSSR
ncbi:MAG TPA: hypothetical protein H9684_04015 [Firmicutes bacterium]|nr:hypothetical protein [Bacillota bacterium]